LKTRSDNVEVFAQLVRKHQLVGLEYSKKQFSGLMTIATSGNRQVFSKLRHYTFDQQDLCGHCQDSVTFVSFKLLYKIR